MGTRHTLYVPELRVFEEMALCILGEQVCLKMEEIFEHYHDSIDKTECQIILVYI